MGTLQRSYTFKRTYCPSETIFMCRKEITVAGERVHWQHSYQSTNVEMGVWHDVLLQVSIAGVLRLRKYMEQEAHLREKGLYLFNWGFTLCAFSTSYDKEKLVSINQRRRHWRRRRWVAGTLGVMAALGSWEVRMGYLCLRQVPLGEGREESVPQERAGQERSGAPGWKTFKLLLKGYHVHRWGFYKDEK